MTDLHGNPGAMGVSAQLKAAREAKGFTLDDVATRTRVPIRHLQHIEAGEWNQLPAITYTVGFVRSYANSVGLNGTELGAELRGHLGGGSDKRGGTPLYEPADPARVPPRALAIAAGLLALALVIGYLIWRTNAADEPDMLELATQPEPAVPATPPVVPQPAAAPATGPVVLTAVSDLWLRINDAGGAKLREGVLKAGERFEIPAYAQQPQITTGRPDALRVTVGPTVIPPLGPAKQTIADVSLLPQDLLARVQAPVQAQAGAGLPASAQPAPAPRQRTPRPAAAQPAASQPAATPPVAVLPAPAPSPAQPAPAQPEPAEPTAPPTE